MTRPFQLGDRVAAYFGVSAYEHARRVLGVVSESDERGVRVTTDGSTNHAIWFHPKQLRRLRPKPRREWTLTDTGDGPGRMPDVEGPALKPGETVRVKEVKEKK